MSPSNQYSQIDHNVLLSPAGMPQPTAAGNSANLQAHLHFTSSTTNSLTWSNLHESNDHYQGLTTWYELYQLIDFVALNSVAKPINCFAFNINQWMMDSLFPSAELLNALQSLLNNLLNTRIEIILQSQLMLVPEIYTITSAHIVQGATATSTAYWHNNYHLLTQWQTEAIAPQPALTESLEFAEDYGDEHANSMDMDDLNPLLNTILKTPLGKLGVNTLGDFFAALFQATPLELNEPATARWAQVVTLNTSLSNWLLAHQAELSLGLIYLNPMNQIIASYQRKFATGGVYSLGAGQMIALLDLTRKIIDHQQLPIDYPLLADNRSLKPINEIATTGKRRSILNDLWINPVGKKPIAVFNSRQRLELLEIIQPQVMFLNVKASALNEIMSTEFCQTIAAFKSLPILVTPAKSYSVDGAIPYRKCYAQLQAFDHKLAQNLCVMGGFFAAPNVLQGSLVHMVLAAESPEVTAQITNILNPMGINPKLVIETLTGAVSSAALMAGGANKNFLTYYASRIILRQSLQLNTTNLSTNKPSSSIEAINSLIEQSWHTNLAANEQIVTNLLLDSQSQTSEAMVITSDGLAADFRHCLPQDGQGILTLSRHIQHLNDHLHKLTTDSRWQVAKPRLHKMLEIIRRDRPQLMGTRNARDGFIDEVLVTIWRAWRQPELNITPQNMNFKQFYSEFYPKVWSGENAQEGRNGFEPLYAKAQKLTKSNPALQWPDMLAVVRGMYTMCEVE